MAKRVTSPATKMPKVRTAKPGKIHNPADLRLYVVGADNLPIDNIHRKKGEVVVLDKKIADKYIAQGWAIKLKRSK